MIAGFLKWLFEPGHGLAKTPASRADFRNDNNKAAIVFIHGFTGNAHETWSTFVDHILKEPSLTTWDVYALGFASSLRVDVVDVWAADPGLNLVALQLATTLSHAPFRGYEAISIVAHSMGGLAVQRALLDSPSLRSRVSSLFFFGTPSGGLPKSRLVKKLKRQFRDMSPDSPFIKSLRQDWNEKFPSGLPFSLYVIGGERDDFVPSSTSLAPFPAAVRASVPGNHVEIIRPFAPSHQSVRIVVEALTVGDRPMPPIDGARLAVELGRFRRAIDVLLPQAAALDDNAVVSLALALESVGKPADALAILERHFDKGSSSTEALGALAGRLKRRWLVTGNAIDHERSLSLYKSGLDKAEACSNHEQAFYHAINVAFLKLLNLAPYDAVSAECKDMALRAIAHCEQCEPDQWSLATEGEALLMLEKLDLGVAKYKEAIVRTSSQRQIDSMYAQALRTAERMFGEEGVMKIEEAFGLRPVSANSLSQH